MIFFNLIHHHHQPNSTSFFLPWFITSLINSVYSIWWDIVHDWGFLNRGFFKSKNSKNKSSLQNQKILLFANHPSIYFLATLLNVILRLTWIIGIWSHPNNQLEFGLELLEIFRRSIWCLFRIEWAEISKTDHHQDYVQIIDSSHQFGYNYHDLNDRNLESQDSNLILFRNEKIHLQSITQNEF
ncbi:hypothetical protein O181_010400 [Austropuccinia psidii MF-1]|uniref:EXS domain-containing protein n=1 Tax=Austropuccinia psidii MF-1 TaxID=1389203 RepID=A0A9Q3BTT0_9BASI|nr:hypothetical protein [Austropuccinia psidii MF-1]